MEPRYVCVWGGGVKLCGPQPRGASEALVCDDCSGLILTRLKETNPISHVAEVALRKYLLRAFSEETLIFGCIFIHLD